MCHMSSQHPIDRVAAAVAEEGGLSEIARQLGVSSQALSNWKARGVPAQYCMRLAELSKSTVSLKELRPNDWRHYWPHLDEKPTKRTRKTA